MTYSLFFLLRPFFKNLFKNNLKLLWYTIILITAITACKKDLDIEVKPDSNRLLVYPELNVGKPINLALNKVLGIDESINYILPEGKTLVYEENKLVDTIFTNTKGLGKSDIIVKSNTNYLLKGDYNGFSPFEILTTTPGFPEILKIDTSTIYLKSSTTTQKCLKITLTIKDNPENQDFYMLEFQEKYYSTYSYKADITSLYYFIPKNEIDVYFSIMRNYRLANEPRSFMDDSQGINVYSGIQYVEGYRSYLSDNQINGREFKLEMFVRNGLIGIETGVSQLIINLSSLSPEYYKVIYSYAKYNTNQSQLLPISEPVPIYSNVLGGCGFAASSATAVDSSISSQSFKDLFKQ